MNRVIMVVCKRISILYKWEKNGNERKENYIQLIFSIKKKIDYLELFNKLAY